VGASEGLLGVRVYVLPISVFKVRWVYKDVHL